MADPAEPLNSDWVGGGWVPLGDPEEPLRKQTGKRRKTERQKGRKKELRKRRKQTRTKKVRSRAMRRLNMLRKVAIKSTLERPFRGGTWNTRGLGAAAGSVDPRLKVECILALMSSRRWEYAMLTDLKFSQNGVREYEYKGRKWSLIIRGKVGVMLSSNLTAEWREGGSKVAVAGRHDSMNTRSVSITWPKKGKEEDSH